MAKNKLLLVAACFLQSAVGANAMQFSSLLKASQDGNVQFIRAYNGNVNQWGGYPSSQARFTVLHKAIKNRQGAAVQALLDKGADSNRTFIVNHPNYFVRYKPLHLAVKAGDYAIVMMLLNANADPNRKDGYKRTPLFCAAKKGLTEIACALIRAGANPEAVCGKAHQNAYQVAPEATRIAMINCSTAASFAAINHPRCGAESPGFELPVYVVAEIAEYLKIEA